MICSSPGGFGNSILERSGPSGPSSNGEISEISVSAGFCHAEIEMFVRFCCAEIDNSGLVEQRTFLSSGDHF